MPTATPQFGQFYTAYLSTPEWMALPSRASKVYSVLVGYANSKTRSWVLRVKSIIDKVGFSRSTVFRALADLETAGLVERVHRFTESRRQVANRYRLLPPLSMRGKVGLPVLEFNLEGGGVTSDTPGGVTGDTPITENKITEISPPTPRFAEGASIDLTEDLQGSPEPTLIEAAHDVQDSDPQLARKAQQAERARLRLEQQAALQELVTQELDQLAGEQGAHIYRWASSKPLHLVGRLASYARSRGLSGRRRDILKAMAHALQGRDLKAPEPAQVVSVDLELLSVPEREELEAAMMAAGFMTPEAMNLYATPEGWELYKQRMGQLALQLQADPERRTPCR